MKEILSCREVTKTYGESQSVLNHVEVRMAEGEFVAVMGPSGSGKSTLLYALCGMEPVDEGSIEFDTKDIRKMNEKQGSRLRRTEMGFVFQQPGMLTNLNIKDNIMLPAIHERKKDYEKIEQKAEELMQRTGIAELSDRRITEVSGGQLQRAGICRALMNNPRIVFADEPTGALNSAASAEIMKLFCEIRQQGTAIFLVSHDRKVAACADRVLFFVDGCVKQELDFVSAGIDDISERQELLTKIMQEIGV